jgi:hypothetical protein
VELELVVSGTVIRVMNFHLLGSTGKSKEKVKTKRSNLNELLVTMSSIYKGLYLVVGDFNYDFSKNVAPNLVVLSSAESIMTNNKAGRKVDFVLVPKPCDALGFNSWECPAEEIVISKYEVKLASGQALYNHRPVAFCITTKAFCKDVTLVDPS